MNQLFHLRLKSIAAIIIVGMLFSCINDSKKVRDFLAEKNLPIAVAKDAHHIYKDSGRITSKLTTSLLNDFSNRKKHPYNEFPQGLKIINFENNGKDSITVFGDYALSYSKTSISELKGNVVVINHTDASRLETHQLFWDQKNKYFFTEKSFILTKINDTVIGVGFESMENLKKYVAKKTVGNIVTNENEL
ncbi:MAG: LPS export ABC transporter periplasmic protein LptC [Flavobacterium sp.]|nr:LPS export ABC transporter periplasmic protein LptC [Flavobacterium sp.]